MRPIAAACALVLWAIVAWVPAVLWADKVPPSDADCACPAWLRLIESCAHQSKFGAGAALTHAYVAFSFSITLYLHASGWAVAIVLLGLAARRGARLVPRWVGPAWTANEIAWTAVIVTQVLKRTYPAEARPPGAEKCTASSGFPSGHACITSALLVGLLAHAGATRRATARGEEGGGGGGGGDGGEQDVAVYALAGAALLLPVAPSRLVLRYHTLEQVLCGVALGAALGGIWHAASLSWRRHSASAAAAAAAAAPSGAGAGAGDAGPDRPPRRPARRASLWGPGDGADLARLPLARRAQCHVALVMLAHALGAWGGARLYWFAAPDIAAAAVLGGMAMTGSAAQWTPKSGTTKSA
jgi:hypothetical protein